MGFNLIGQGGGQRYPGAFCDQVLAINLNASVNDFAPGAGGNVTFADANTFEINCASAASITGLAGGRDGRILRLVNVGSATITIPSQDAGSVAANRFNFAATIATGVSLTVQYSSALARWVKVSGGDATSSGVTQTTGTFTVTWQGFTTVVQTTFSYVQTGSMVCLSPQAPFSGTSNATTLDTAAGAIPAALRPIRRVAWYSPVGRTDNGASSAAGGVWFNTDGSIQFGLQVLNGVLSPGGFTAAGTKGGFLDPSAISWPLV